jgi:hypothetical protein
LNRVLYFDVRKINIFLEGVSCTFAVCGLPGPIDTVEQHRGLFLYLHLKRKSITDGKYIFYEGLFRERTDFV